MTTMMTTTMEDIPSAVLTCIIRYLDDPQSICALEGTSKSFQVTVQESACWSHLHRQRWTTTASTSSTGRRRPRDYKKEYRRRYLLDQQLQGCIDTLLLESTEREQVVRTVTQVMSHGRDSLDLCWNFWKRYKDTCDDRSEYNRDELIALCLLRSVHCAAVLEDIKDLCTTSDHHDDNPAIALEEYVITSSRMFFDVKEHGPTDSTSKWIRQQLDDIAVQVKQRWLATLPCTDDDTTTTIMETKLELFNTVFFDELNFTGNTQNYYDFQNSMIHSSLQRRTGIPMTLAVLYKCVARRLQIQVDIIGLPGHIVIGVPALESYVDVFRKGRRLLTVMDCERIVNSYGHAMMPEYIQPLTPAQVFRRILNNCSNCLSQIFPPNASKRMAIEAMRAILINPTQEQVDDCRRWFCSVLWGNHSTAHLQEMSKW